jgi:hypothetical protein
MTPPGIVTQRDRLAEFLAVEDGAEVVLLPLRDGDVIELGRVRLHYLRRI